MERDPVLRRVERDAVVACAALAVIAAALTPSHLPAAAGVVGGGVLVSISYRGIKGGIDAAVEFGGNRPGSGWFGLVKFFTRYGILAAVAYVIMARLRLPPVAVVAGASSLVVAVIVEAVRSLRQNPPRNTG